MGSLYYRIVKVVSIPYLKSRYITMVVVSQRLQHEILTFNLKDWAEEQTIFYSLNAISGSGHWDYGIPKIVFGHVKA